MGLGSRKPIRGSVDHMYGVFGFAPNKSVKSFQKSVSRSRRKKPLDRTESPSPLRLPTAAVNFSFSAATSGSFGVGGVGNSAPMYARRPAIKTPSKEHRVREISAMWPRCAQCKETLVSARVCAAWRVQRAAKKDLLGRLHTHTRIA